MLKYAKKYLGKHVDVKKILSQLENPVDIIETLIQKADDENSRNRNDKVIEKDNGHIRNLRIERLYGNQ